MDYQNCHGLQRKQYATCGGECCVVYNTQHSQATMPLVLVGLQVEDKAMLERLLVVPHRSRFFLDDVPDEPYSFKADPSIKMKFDVWRPYMLRWLLQGLQRFHVMQFSDIPSTCLAFKQMLLEDEDIISLFLTEAVTPGTSEDYVQLKELWAKFPKEHKREKSPKVFKKAVEAALGMAKDVHNYTKPNGKKTIARSVFLGYKMQSADDMQMD